MIVRPKRIAEREDKADQDHRSGKEDRSSIAGKTAKQMRAMIRGNPRYRSPPNMEHLGENSMSRAPPWMDQLTT